MPFLQGQDLIGHLDGSSLCPQAPTVSSTSSSLALTTLDYNLTSLLISSLSDEAFSLIIGLTLSKQIWDALEAAYASISNTRILFLYISLQELKHKADESINSFLQRVKAIVDELATANRPLLSVNFNIYIFRALCEVQDSHTASAEPPSFL
ncbi:hypothetical protein NE237_013527 [Protea cynaroides]|uniref:Uncharacterized protein n=1 Tax=Protea cynaroides TaxID=273540 RepID=A0A9Q0H046_9MAGN|nr:hypothetical protein NE237_013527 [Protea cynaroides]